MMLDITQALQPLAACFLAAENESDSALCARIQLLGLSKVEAQQWALLMPLAFARAAYRFQLPPLSDEVEWHEGGDCQHLQLSQLAPYSLALSWAMDCGAMDAISSPQYNAIVRRSVEFAAIQQLRQGEIAQLPRPIITMSETPNSY
ncbi:hypothetical protein CHH28_07240 [Bacterioplanes sanyensis]|uniref:Uncharacterized protein n=1 Tax=Bacterioplanes sanyensis TaxID=1249553 RepID=A0A222FI96_9GAMM|nr:hypothetical protein [Bacterioplanes sanyensis]ASP38479.1 hypothetical protein CHH28_07240 [Bacterioplanes sanyensis]